MKTDTPKTDALDERYTKFPELVGDEEWRLYEHAQKQERENARLETALAELHSIAEECLIGAYSDRRADFDAWTKANAESLSFLKLPVD